MKHSVKITLILLLIFLLAQFIGLLVVSQYIDIKTSALSGKTVLNEETYDITGIQPPEIENESLSFIYIALAIVIGTVLILLIIKYKKRYLWKIWFFLSVFICLLISLSPFVYLLLLYLVSGLEILAYPVTFVLAALFAWMKTWRNNVYVHNFTELFIYGGLAAVIVPVLNMTSVVIIIVIISIYDMYAVWKSKHMVKMAKFQAKEKLFAGLYIPYSIGNEVTKKISKRVGKIKKGKGVKVKTGSAILGGGDIAFPLLFSGVLFKTTGMVFAHVITSLTSMLALGLLFFYSQKKKFYPAMPFIATGLFIGYGLVRLVLLI